MPEVRARTGLDVEKEWDFWHQERFNALLLIAGRPDQFRSIESGFGRPDVRFPDAVG